MRRISVLLALVGVAVFGVTCGGSDSGSTTVITAPKASVLQLQSGDAQHARITRPLAQPIVVAVRTADGAAVSGATVSFAATSGGSATPASATTAANGTATTQWTLGATPGSQSLTASLSGASSTVSITATADPAVSASLTVLDGNEQSAVVGTAVLVAPSVQLREQSGAPISGVTVRFAVSAGGGTVSGADVVTNATGVAQVGRWSVGTTTGSNSVTASILDADVVAPAQTFAADAVPKGTAASYPARSYPINTAAPLTLSDTVTGVKFAFAGGASGTLSVARLASVSALPADEGVGARIRWAGSGSPDVILTRTTAREPQLFAWGRPLLSMETADSAQWLPVGHVDSPNDDVRFRLNDESVSASVGLRALTGVAAQTWGSYFMGVFAYTATEKAFLAARQADARSAVQTWLQLMTDPALRARAQALVSGTPLRFSTGRKCPSAYTTLIGVLSTPTIYLCSGSGSNPKQGFHEAGHYMTDVMLYDAGKSTSVLYLAPGMINSRVAHDWGVSWMGFRKTITEDYAFYSEYLGQGKVGGAWTIDGQMPDFAQLLNGSGRTPGSMDYPSMEGFGVSLIGTMLRTDTSAYDFTALSKIPVPVSGLTKNDIVAILSTGPKNVTELRNALAGRLATDKLQVIAEQVGWSYNGLGRVVDGSGLPVAGAEVASVVKVGARAYRTTSSTSTGADGKFYLPRLYPGTSTLRVYVRGTDRTDSADVGAATVAWETPTNTAQALGDLVYQSFSRFTRVAVSVYGLAAINRAVGATVTCSPNFFVNSLLSSSFTDGQNFPVIWNGSNFAMSASTSWEATSYAGAKERQSHSSRLIGSIEPGRGDTLWVTATGAADDIGDNLLTSGWTRYLTSNATVSLVRFPVVRSGTTAYRATLLGTDAMRTVSAMTYSYVWNSSITGWSQQCTPYTLDPSLARVDVSFTVP